MSLSRTLGLLRPATALLAAAALAVAPLLSAQQGYQQPPAPIARILDAEPAPAVFVSPTREWLLLAARKPLPSLAEVAAPMLRLAGERIDPRTNGRSRTLTFDGLSLRAVTGNGTRRIQTPAPPSGGAPRLGNVMWSPDGAFVAYTATADSGIALWVADLAACSATSCPSRQLSGAVLNGTTGEPCTWVSAGRARAPMRLVCRMVVATRGAPPVKPAVPSGPIVQEASGRAAGNRTYEDLLASPYDEALFTYYFTDQLALVALDGSSTPVGAPGIHTAASPSPDGQYLQVTTVHTPYSYTVPMERFPQRMEVWRLDGSVAKLVADRPLNDQQSTAFDAVPAGPRALEWRTNAPATLTWTEALDGGNPATTTTQRDRLVALAAPFTGQPVTLLDVGSRIRDVLWARGDLALVTEYWWRTRRTRTWTIAPERPGAPARKLFDRSTEDRYGDPGRFVTAPGAFDAPVLLTTADGRSAYLVGQGASPQGDRPFLDRMVLATGKATRLWRSEAPYYEEVVTVLDGAGRRAITRRESVTDVPNYYVRDIGTRALTQLTAFTDPAPEFAGVTKQLIRYMRPDSVALSATLYLPAGYDQAKDGPLPFLFWAYPREFKSASAAAQVTGSPYRFTRPSGASPLFLLTQGYGVLDGPTMPIVGEGTSEPNDTYVKQLVASAAAAVDKVVAMGVADRGRIAVGGHSYGAFMTANLLAHSRLFRAGIARSGAYNRTLTPFGFQQEERPYWKAREVYERMSPFTYADSVAAPLLLIHGMADDNSGTFPIQSERFYAALQGNGATVRYVQLPAEAHGYLARESVGHTLWEMVTWLDRYVKTPERAEAK